MYWFTINEVFTIIFLGFDVTMMILCAVHFAKKKRTPFVFLMLSFAVSVALAVINLAINYSMLSYRLNVELGMDPAQAAMIILIVGIGFASGGVVSAVFLLVGIILLAREEH